MLTSAAIKRQARLAGFDLCGVAPAAAFPELRSFRDWLDRGFAARMGYLARTAARREDVRRVLPSARSVIVTGTLYNVVRPASRAPDEPGEAIISRYAWGDDYHDVIGRRLDALVARLREAHDGPLETRAYVDTGPVSERTFARYAGIGWIGKHGCVVREGFGSWLFLSVILCSLPIEPDTPAVDRCGSCTLCIDACPTGAIVGPRVVDARRCLSYLTVELRKAVPEPLRRPVGAHVFGCDVCQEVCPWNEKAPVSGDPHWLPRAGLDRPRLADLWRRSDDELSALVRGSVMARPGIPGLRRNIAIALGNSRADADREALDTLDQRDDAPSVRDAVVQEHVEWARSQSRSTGCCDSES